MTDILNIVTYYHFKWFIYPSITFCMNNILNIIILRKTIFYKLSSGMSLDTTGMVAVTQSWRDAALPCHLCCPAIGWLRAWSAFLSRHDRPYFTTQCSQDLGITLLKNYHLLEFMCDYVIFEIVFVYRKMTNSWLPQCLFWFHH